MGKIIVRQMERRNWLLVHYEVPYMIYVNYYNIRMNNWYLGEKSCLSMIENIFSAIPLSTGKKLIPVVLNIPLIFPVRDLLHNPAGKIWS